MYVCVRVCVVCVYVCVQVYPVYKKLYWNLAQAETFSLRLRLFRSDRDLSNYSGYYSGHVVLVQTSPSPQKNGDYCIFARAETFFAQADIFSFTESGPG